MQGPCKIEVGKALKVWSGAWGKSLNGDAMKKNTLLCALLVSVVLPLSIASADMGQIHASPVTVSETSQKAIILHNCTEEVLILGTDLHAEQETGIIRFIPFPSAPHFDLPPEDVFSQAADLLKKYNLQFLMASKGGGTEAKPVELLLQKKLGAHDMTVIKVNDPREFRDWANTYFVKKGLPVKAQYEEAETIVADYVQRGLRYFVLDYVELTEESRFIEPVLYRFASKDLYYPLKNTNTFGGQGGIDLVLLVPGSMCAPTVGAYDTCLGLPAFTQRVEASTTSAVDQEDILSLYADAGEFFGGRQVFMQMVTYWGDYAFDNDIFADVTKAYPYAFGHAEKQQGSPWVLPIEDVIRGIDQRFPESNADKNQ